MTQIGMFTRTTDGYTGTIRTLTLNRDVVIIVPAVEIDTENAPNYRVLAGDVEIGATWKRTGDKAGDYLALTIDDPSFGRPIRANLFQVVSSGDSFHLIWTRPSCRAPRD
ncbi:DUF736 domain-containing protein [Bradyrhizobium sp. dw_78]|uniref:DUF736 domain-containing protein n=1 Tax=Bradyrhizobium sp. dw_78 TaxID=2719793 RepID=UPI001BD35774|nr:DUF736 domain-containing protein [Bradyrhizobium sp. dw_78]